MVSPLRGRHAFPTLKRPRLSRESQPQYRRERVLRVHHCEHAFGRLLRAPDTSLVALHLHDPLADFAARRMVQRLEPFAQRGVFAEEALQLRGNNRNAFRQIGLEAKLADMPWRTSPPFCMAL